MIRLREFLKTTLVGGLGVLLPVGLLIGLTARAITTLRDQLGPLVSHLPYGDTLPVLLAALILLVACFLTGLVVRTRAGKRIGYAVEHGVLAKIPGYLILKRLSQRVAGQSDDIMLAPALVRAGEGLVPAFIVEEHSNGDYTVFVPTVPTPAVGAIYIVRRERVHHLDVPMRKVLQCIAQWGHGSKELFDAMQRSEHVGPRPSDEEKDR
ncbi:MAG: DUF502 domain-containing protein [Candidatus Hydrogenedentes bacterium]|nr:DUF502 domain-containing protein [Candidatus Hydrogenedentota bacterium]